MPFVSLLISLATFVMSGTGFLVRLTTPQSIKRLNGEPSGFLKVIKWQSPKPWRYVRTRTLPGGAVLSVLLPGFFGLEDRLDTALAFRVLGIRMELSNWFAQGT